MKKLVRSILVFVMNLLALASAQLAKTGTWFQQITDSSDNGEAVLNECFHRCSMSDRCQFVVKDLTENTFKEVSDEKDLPIDTKSHKIWKKMRKGTIFQVAMKFGSFSSTFCTRRSYSTFLKFYVLPSSLGTVLNAFHD